MLLLCLVPGENKTAAKLSCILQSLIPNRGEKRETNKNKTGVLSGCQRLNYEKHPSVKLSCAVFLVDLVAEVEQSNGDYSHSA